MKERKVIAHITATARIPLPANIFNSLIESLWNERQSKRMRRGSTDHKALLEGKHPENTDDGFLPF
jgi:hypothetical protein